MSGPRVWRVEFRPPVTLATARSVIAAALADEGLVLATPTHGGRPLFWSAIAEPGCMAVYVDPRAILPSPTHPSHREEPA